MAVRSPPMGNAGTSVRVRTLTERDRAWVRCRLDEDWGGPVQARAGMVGDVAALPGFVVDVDRVPTGFATYAIVGAAAELAVLDAGTSGRGIGTMLTEAVAGAARSANATELWVVTTNDNIDALRFYQRRGFRLRSVRPGAVDEVRRSTKPEIAERGHHGIAIHDEIELVRRLL